MSTRTRFLAPLAALLAAGCDGGTGAARPAKVEAASAPAAAQVATQLPAPAGVRVLDAGGRPLAGVVVHFSTDAPGAWISRNDVLTDGAGTAQVTWVLGTRAGDQELTAAVNGLDPLRIVVRALPGPATRLRAWAGDGQTAPAGTVLATAPAVKLVDAFGNGIAGVAVRFALTGGGSVPASTAQTDAEGVASPGAWTLGAVAGTNALLAVADGVDSVAMTALGVPGAPHHYDLRGDDQRGPAGSVVAIHPALRVFDAAGNAVAGVQVTFAATEGGGSVASPSVVTDADGIARAGAWTLGPAPGTNRVTATVAGGAPAVFTADAVAPSGYDLDLHFLVPTSDRNRQAFAAAAARWTRVVRGDIPDVHLKVAADQCFAGQPAIDEWIDDLAVLVVVDSIDGPGKILAATGVCYVRRESGLPLVGVMIMDSADLAMLDAKGWMIDVVTHEMGHALGIGSLWAYRGMLQYGTDPQFLGTSASAQYGRLIGTAHAGVPVEDQGGPGTAMAHWRERVFGDELMTGYIAGTPNPLSALTVASLEDLGYRVDITAADAYALPPAAVRGGAPAPVPIGETLLNLPTRTVDADGTVHPLP
jgi:hypothetical protein